MNSRNTRFLLLAALSLAAAQLHAGSLVDGSAEAGKAKSITCTACHGAEGNSVNPLWPNNAGQGAPYVVAQLQAFKGGLRNDPLMAPQAMALSDEDMRDLAVYFESLPAAAQAVASPATVNRGEALCRRWRARVPGLSRPDRSRQSGRQVPRAAGAARGVHREDAARLCLRGAAIRRQDPDHARHRIPPE